MAKTSLFHKTPWVIGAGLLVAMCCVAYFPFIHNSFVWDDDLHLTKSPYLNSLDGLKHIWFDLLATPQYYPLVFTSFWIEHQFWALDPFGYHVDNIILHSINTILLWRVLSLLEIKGSWLAAALFAIHPVQVESVAWISERKNLLFVFFYFLSVYFFLLFDNPGQPHNSNDDPHEKKPWRLYVISLFFFVCSLLSKTVACTLPAVILLICWWKQNRIGKKFIFSMIPYFIVGLGFALLTIYVEKNNVGALGGEWAFSFWDRFLIAGRALWFYMAKLVWPTPIIFIYPRWVIDDSMGWQYIYPVAFLFLIFSLWYLRNNIGRGPLTAVLFFAGSLFPVLGFFNIYFIQYSLVADHFQYLACIGIIALFASGVDTLIGRIKPQTAFFLLAGLLIVLGNLTWNLAPAYKNTFSLWEDTIRKNPSAWMAHTNLGNILARSGQRETAITHFRAAVEAKPDYLLAHNNLAMALAESGKPEEAIIHYKTAIKIKPDYFLAHFNLGNTLAGTGRLEEAIIHHRAATKIEPYYFPAQYNFANTLAKNGQLAEAIFHYKIAVKIAPDEEAHNNLGIALQGNGQLEQAITHFKTAIKIKPDYAMAHGNLKKALLLLKD